MDERMIVYGLWAVGSVLAWGKVLVDGWGSYRRFGDRRAQREFSEDVGLFLVAAAAAASLGLLVVGRPFSDYRGFILAMALGSFLAVGITKASGGVRRRGRYGRRVGDKR